MRVVALLLAALLTNAPKIEFVSEDAEAHFDRAQEAFASRDYDLASSELHAAYELEPIPRLLYARAQAERFGEHWALAAELYGRFLDGDPPEKGRAIAEQHALFVDAQLQRAKGHCDEADALFVRYAERYPDSEQAAAADAAIGDCERPSPTAVDAVDPPPAKEAPTTAPRPQPPRVSPPVARTDTAPPRAWFADPWSGALLAGGVAGLGTGTALLVSADRLVRVAEHEGRHSAANHHLSQGRRQQSFGVAALGVGTAMLTGAIVRYVILARRSRSTASRRSHQLGQRRP